MSTSTLLPSMAGTHQKYVALQARTYGPTELHIQGAGVSVNRDYGVAVTVTVPAELAAFFNKQPQPLVSLATNRRYAGFQARVREDSDTIHCQMADGGMNRTYGSSFDIKGCPELAEFITKQTEFIKAQATLPPVPLASRTFYVEGDQSIYTDLEVEASSEEEAISEAKKQLHAVVDAMDFSVYAAEYDEGDEDCEEFAPTGPHAVLL